MASSHEALWTVITGQGRRLAHQARICLRTGSCPVSHTSAHIGGGWLNTFCGTPVRALVTLVVMALGISSVWMASHVLIPPRWVTLYADYAPQEIGRRGSTAYRATLFRSGVSASFWHDISLLPADLDASAVVPMVIEIPVGNVAKMEINKETALNPIIQDTKNGKLRDYPFPNVAHYGAIPQTYEHPKLLDLSTGLKGDGDPVDALDISEEPADIGAVVSLQVIGAVGMIDDGEIDWKIIGVRVTDPLASRIRDLSAVMDTVRIVHTDMGKLIVKANSPAPAPDRLDAEQQRVRSRVIAITNFFRDYKRPTPDAESPVTFAFEGKPLDAASATELLRQHHVHWCKLVDSRLRKEMGDSQAASRLKKHHAACAALPTPWMRSSERGDAPSVDVWV